MCDMHQVFEEVVAESLDELYAGALYLCAGREGEAESLLTASLVEASRRYGKERPTDPVFFLETQLVRALLGGGGSGRAPFEAGPPGMFRAGGGEAAEVLAALAGLNGAVRCTIWLVVVRRRRYNQVAEALRTDREQVAAWVREGHRRMSRSGFARRFREKYEA
jgi:hypothetical protein